MVISRLLPILGDLGAIGLRVLTYRRIHVGTGDLQSNEAKIKAVLEAEGCSAERFDIVATTEVIEMGDHPAKTFQAKADSSITVGFGYLAKGCLLYTSA